MTESDSMYRSKWDSVKHHFFPTLGELAAYEALPLIIYALDNEGNFLWYNAKCRETFNLPERADGTISILDFYVAPIDRNKYLTELNKKSPGEWLEDSLLDFMIGQKHYYLKDISKRVESAPGEPIGIISIMQMATTEERYKKLFDRLPIGVFKFLKEGDGLDYANDKFVKMHGYQSLDELRGAPVKTFIDSTDEARQLIGEVRETGIINNRIVKHKRQAGPAFWGSINAVALLDEEGNYLGTEGTIVDVTMEGLYNALIQVVPIGLFKVEINNKGEHIIVHCNDTFAHNLGRKSRTDLIGSDIRKFHGTLEDFDKFYANMLESDRKGAFHEAHIVNWIHANTTTKEYQVYVRLERDNEGNVIGRVGAQRDVTEERKLGKRIEELRSDIGKVLHAYSTTLIMAKINFEVVLNAMTAGRGAYFDGNMFNEGFALLQIDQSVRTVQSGVKRLQQDLGQMNSPNAVFLELIRLADILKEVGQTERSNFIASNNHEAAAMISEHLGNNDYFKKQPKEKIRPLRQALDELIRCTSIIFLHRGMEGVLEMEAPVQTLRSYIVDGVKGKEEMVRLSIYDILYDVIKSLESYGASRGIEIKYHLRDIQNLYLSGSEPELKRAFTNLLHNAIKYSWTRRTGSIPFVDVTARKETNWVTITMVNRGVGISRREIESGKIFEFGYRGEKSNDRRRPGTGIGLYDAKKVIEAHLGTLTIDSKPVSGNPEIDTPNQPYFSTVTCRIPINPS